MMKGPIVVSGPLASTASRITQSLEAAKATRIAQIKLEAAERIAATDWRLDRARERAEQGIDNPETEADVLAEREAIRQASNAAETAVMSLSSVEEVTAFSW